jgi:geranylgeranyl diphosphate synthase type I
MSLQKTFDRLLPQIEAELREVTRPPHPDLAPYYGMMNYHLGWVDSDLQPVQARSGKRLRPAICLLSCEAVGGEAQYALPAAAAVELIHSFSLVHDDIQDSSHFRRGRRAVWDIWGVPHGINVGDGLFALARLALNRLEASGLSLSRWQAATRIFDEACLALCEGQFFDMAFEARMDVDLDQYLWMIRNKTARLFAASVQLGAIVGSGDPALIERYCRFGENLGMAFQIQDDILGTWGDERITGKSAATDIRDKKKTLPVVYVLQNQEERYSAWRLMELYGMEGPLDELAVEETLQILEQAGARQYAEEAATSYYTLALQSLDEAGLDNAANADLRELAASLLSRAA